MIKINERYKITFDKLANKLVFWQISDRYHILFIQSLLFPLQKVQQKFEEWAIEKSIEANMTSQVMYFEWFLNRKLSKYFNSNNDAISINDGGSTGVPIYSEKNKNAEHYLVKTEEEGHEDLSPLYKSGAKDGKYSYSFVVNVPQVTKIKQSELNDAVRYWVDKYKVAGKTYNIIVNE